MQLLYQMPDDFHQTPDQLDQMPDPLYQMPDSSVFLQAYYQLIIRRLIPSIRCLILTIR